MHKLVSFDIQADFGVLKKPDTNDPMYLTFNMLHKPALLGILGAIVGMEGFKEPGKMPFYYNQLHDLNIGIQPLNHENGNFQKTIIRYNNGTGFANLDGGNLIVLEQTLIKPSYRCFLLLDIKNEIHQDLYDYLKSGNAVYLPYLGKNEFALWWENFVEWNFEQFDPDQQFKIDSLFIKEEPLKDGTRQEKFSLEPSNAVNDCFMYFENLPVSYDQALLQYNYKTFAFTNFNLINQYQVNDLYRINSNTSTHVIQLF